MTNWIASAIALSSVMLVGAASISSFVKMPQATLHKIADKTLVAWVTPSNLEQRGGSVLTLEKPGGVFDGIVFGERSSATWMAGSENFKRTKADQSNFPHENSLTDKPVQVVIVYRGKEIELYRNGTLQAKYANESAEQFGSDSKVLIGLRHTDASTAGRYFVGSVDDARIYDSALTGAEISALVPHHLSSKKPLAWWDFKDGALTDRMNAFPVSVLYGDARISGGKLQLTSEGAYLMASTAEAMPVSTHPNDVDDLVRSHREKLLKDPYRPGYHFAIPEGIAMPFDPNGAIYWKGQYHLFYIFQDKRGHNLGHISSTDLFHWRQHPAGPVSGMFSGNCFINMDGRPTLCYHQVDQGNAMAVALDDDLNEWKKLDSNPITPKTKPGDKFDGLYRSWDPDAWVEGNNYYAIFGGNRPAIVKSPKLEGEWKYVGDLMANAVPGVSIDEDVSCADFFKIGNKRMLLCISHRLGCRYYLGEWKNEQFHPTYHEKMSWVDNSYFAPESLLDSRGRRIMWAWIFDKPGFGTRTDGGWSGTMSLPRVLELGADGMLRMNPPPEIEQLRYNPQSRSNLQVSADGELPLSGLSGNSIEVNLQMSSKDAKQFGIKVCCSPDGSEQTSIYYDAVEKKLKVDTTHSSSADEPKNVEAAPFSLKKNEPLNLRVFVDKSVVEVFANGRQAVMRRIYPSRPDSLGLKLFSVGGAASVSSLKIWDMMPSNAY